MHHISLWAIFAFPHLLQESGLAEDCGSWHSQSGGNADHFLSRFVVRKFFQELVKPERPIADRVAIVFIEAAPL
jgi:hypothetical protein